MKTKDRIFQIVDIQAWAYGITRAQVRNPTTMHELLAHKDAIECMEKEGVSNEAINKFRGSSRTNAGGQ